jgi:hypothetical protein
MISLTPFQALALSLLLGLALWTASAVVRGTLRKHVALLWLGLWCGGALAVIWPQSTAVIAHRLGIGRGADLLLYCSVLAMVAAFFYVYTRFRRVDRQLTLLVRRLAIEGARQPLSVQAAHLPPGREAAASELTE